MYFLIVPWAWSKSDWGWRRRHKSACAKWERSRFKLQHCQSRSTAKCLWLTWGTNQTGRNYLSFILTGKIRLSLPGGGPSDHDERKSNYRGSGFSAHISRNDVGTYVWLSAANWSKDTVCYAWCSKDLKSYRNLPTEDYWSSVCLCSPLVTSWSSHRSLWGAGECSYSSQWQLLSVGTESYWTNISWSCSL